MTSRAATLPEPIRSTLCFLCDVLQYGHFCDLARLLDATGCRGVATLMGLLHLL